MPVRVYLDYNATSPLRPEIKAVMEPMFGIPYNASSMHGYGRDARKLVEDARQSVAVAVNCEPRQVIFTGSGTEANNFALKAADYTQVFVSAIEHPSVLKVIERPVVLPVTADGVVDLERAEALLAQAAPGSLVSVMLANNETGVIQPVKEIAEIAHRYAALMHCDAVQGVGRLSLDFQALGVDMMTIAAHKVGGPVGVGALIVGPCIAMKPLLAGGGQELNRRAGTENVPSIVGFGQLAHIISSLVGGHASGKTESDGGSKLQKRLELAIRAVAPEAHIIGEHAERLPNTTCITMPGVSAETQLMAFDLEGFAVSAGSACTSGKVDVSHVLSAIGVVKEEATTAIRISTGWATTEAEIDAFVEAWAKVFARCGNQRQQEAA